jgi:hypothetical protein
MVVISIYYIVTQLHGILCVTVKSWPMGGHWEVIWGKRICGALVQFGCYRVWLCIVLYNIIVQFGCYMCMNMM